MSLTLSVVVFDKANRGWIAAGNDMLGERRRGKNRNSPY